MAQGTEAQPSDVRDVLAGWDEPAPSGGPPAIARHRPLILAVAVLAIAIAGGLAALRQRSAAP